MRTLQIYSNYQLPITDYQLPITNYQFLMPDAQQYKVTVNNQEQTTNLATSSFVYKWHC